MATASAQNTTPSAPPVTAQGVAPRRLLVGYHSGTAATARLVEKLGATVAGLRAEGLLLRP